MKEIVKIINPKIKLDEISVDDIFEGTSDPSMYSDKKYYKAYGVYAPIASINKYIMGKNDIINLVIDSSSFLPTLNMVFVDKTGVFTSKYYPLDGDIVSVHIRTQNKKYKGVRCDFEITSISGTQSASDKITGTTYSLTGVMKIPNLFVDQCFCWENSTSFDSLLNTSKLLELGFASNETKTNDKQNWICPFSNIKNFIEKTVLHSYLNDNSFFTSYIDTNYHLNFVNVNDIFQINAEPIDVDIVNLFTTEDQVDDKDAETEIAPLILSNAPSYTRSPNYISSVSIFNNSGDINIRNGYRRYIQYYDISNIKYIENFIESFTTEGSEDRKTNKGRDDEDYTKRLKYKYIGEIDDDNVHQNYKHAKILNYQNLEDINKTGIIVDLPTFNPVLRRFMTIPVVIFHYYNEFLSKSNNNSTDQKYSVDNFLSGDYIIKDIKIIYDGSNTYQRLVLVRREWRKN
jgi:hypothetical protein